MARWLLAALLGLASTGRADDWPGYRGGGERDNRSRETGLLASWPADGPPLAWTYSDTGVGYAGPAIAAGRLYILGGRGDQELLIALNLSDAKEGKVSEAWTASVGPTFQWKGNQW